MAISACPFCFTKIDTSNLAYQCSGRPTGGNKCEQAEDPLRVDRTNSRSLSYPTFVAPAGKKKADVLCPHCSGVARRRSCPACHTALPESFVDVESPMLGIVGAKGGGKTVLMTVLTKQLRENIGRRFQASVRFATDNPDGFENVAGYVEGRENVLFNEGKLPPKTTANQVARRRPVVMLWQGEAAGRLVGNRVKSTTLSFLDSAGEDFNELDSAYSLDYLAVCDGLMVTIDPFMIPGARANLTLPAEAIQGADPLQAIERITEVLRVEHGVKRGKRIKLPFAVVFTKIDAFFPTLRQGNSIMRGSASTVAYNETDGENVHEEMKALLQQWQATGIEDHLRLNYDEYRYFGISALGAEPNYALGQVAAGGVQPHRVEDPILWLLSKERTIAAVRA